MDHHIASTLLLQALNACCEAPLPARKPVQTKICHSSNGHAQVAGTQYILDSVIAALRDHPDRTFIYGEMVRFRATAMTNLESPHVSPGINTYCWRGMLQQLDAHEPF